MKRFFKYFLIVFLAVLFLFFVFFFIGKRKEAENIVWGMNFSQKHSKNLGLDWKENYSALLDDLGVKKIKTAVHWDIIEPEEDNYNFQDLDWQIEKAEENNGEVILVIGMKTSRWPECHIPEWAKNIGRERQEEEILEMLKEVILRYREAGSVLAWQVENEFLFPFGKCPWTDENFLKKEIALVKSLDNKNRPIIVTDSGEGSFWFRSAKLGDIVGTTIYKKVWVDKLNFYLTYPFPPIFYSRKAKLIEKLFNKKVICAELQTEPWGPVLLYDLPLEEQKKTMNLEQFKENIEFAKKTGFDTFYLWGGEWMYWLKEKQGQPQIWQEAKNLFK